MLEEGQIGAEEAAELLAALHPEEERSFAPLRMTDNARMADHARMTMRQDDG